MSLRYPFSAIAGQDELLQALLLTAVDPLIGGLLAFGDRGTGKSTAVRALAALLPEIRATSCAYHCDPDSTSAQCDACRKAATHKLRKISIPVVDLPLGATEDRVLGSLNLERDPEGFTALWEKQEDQTRRRIVKARKHLNEVEVPDFILERAATLCIHLKTDGLRGQLTLMRAARALAAFEGAKHVTDDHLKRMAAPSLRHRLRRNPLDETGSTTRITRAVTEVFGA